MHFKNCRSKQVLIINVGNELLDGNRENTHLQWLSAQLVRRGLPVTLSMVVRDNPEDIKRIIQESWKTYDMIVTTGGIGSTTDDHTRFAVAAALGLKLVQVSSAEEALRERFQHIGREVTLGDLKQCYVPDGAQPMRNMRGTALGVFYHRDDKVLIMLPGPSLELCPMFEEEVIPRLQEMGYASPGETYLQIRTFGIGATRLENTVRPLLLPGMIMTFGNCAGVLDARIAAGDSAATDAHLCDIARKVRDIIGEDFVSTGHACLATLVVEQLRSLEKTVALAESCTGGLLANAFTDVPGASQVFIGSAVCYSNDSKINLLGVPECLIAQHGAVSAECAAAMATGVIEKFGTDYAISITGYAGPGGGTDADPVGTVYFGYACPTGVWSRRVTLVGDRRQVKLRAVNCALDFMRRNLNRYRVEDLLHGT